MAKAKKTKTTNPNKLDSVYILKLVLFLILGSQWLYVSVDKGSELPVPIGLIIGLLFASQEHFRLDRKIEYAVLLIAMFIGFWLPMGTYLHL